MTQVIEMDEAGRLVLPPELLGEAKPHTRYTVEVLGDKTFVSPERTALVAEAEQLKPSIG